jgi:peptide alpha-N-acetyltransferase
MLHFLDNIHNNSYFVRAAKIATKIYLLLHDSPEILDEKPENDEKGVTAAELKKLRRKANKQKAQEEKAHDDKNSKPSTKKRVDTDVDFVESAPLDPSKLISTKAPLEEAAKFLQPAILANSPDSELYELAFEVHQRKQKVIITIL